MANLAETLAKPVGPLPLGAWIAVVGGGMGIAWYSQSRSPSAAEEGDVLLAEPDVGEGGSPIFAPVEPGEPSPPEFLTLDGWIAKAIRQAGALGASPLEIERALRLYARGSTLTVKQGDLVNRVIRLIGPAPEGEITDPPSIRPPTTTPPKPKPVKHTYTFTFTQAPVAFKAKRSVIFRGRLLDNGKGYPARSIRIERRHGNGPWRFYKMAATGAGGAFTVRTDAPNPSVSQYSIRFNHMGAQRTFTLKRN